MDKDQVKLACLRIVYPKDADGNTNAEHFISQAKLLYEWVSDRRGRPSKADKDTSPAK